MHTHFTHFTCIIYVNRYLSKETIVQERIQSTADVVDENNMQFIELTICPSYKYAYNDDSLQKYGMDKQGLRLGGAYAPINYSEEMDLRKVFDSVTHEIEELLNYIEIFTLDRAQPQITIDFQESNTTNFIKVVSKYHHNLGKCFSIQPREHVVQLGVVKIDIFARYGLYVYFGYPGQFMYNTKTKVLDLAEFGDIFYQIYVLLCVQHILGIHYT